MSQLQEWIVTLHKHEDLADFYEDMENLGGSLYIPGRVVEVANKRPISRNTHYMLTYDEAMLLKGDSRVWDVELAELIDIATKPCYSITNGSFDKQWGGSTGDPNDINWGLLRQSEASNRSNWGDDGVSTVTSNLTVTASGKNVDVCIIDGHLDPAHPEFAVNSDGTGGSRVTQYNWFQNNIGFGTGTYVYTPYVDGGNAQRTDDNNHGCHCAGTVAGNTQGWAREANIYNISPYSTNQNFGTLGLSASTVWDYVRAWHNSKPINSDTGRRNPTITNNSYGSSIQYGVGDFGAVTRAVYRGVDFDPGRSLTTAELQARGFYATSTQPTVPYYFTSREADLQDAMDDGIIVVVSAGNDYWKTVNSSDQDYGNVFYATYLGSNFVWYSNRGTGSGAGYTPTINVGATSNNVAEDKAHFSNCGSQVDVFAAGEAIQSSVHTLKTFGVADPRSGSYYLAKYQGTSMAGPQVAGILACLAESWPNMTQTEAHAWIVDKANSGQMLDTGADDPMDTNSLQGAPNKYARWINQRTVTGASFPQKNFKTRSSSGVLYPRTRIRRRG
jgi:hypothetical protein